MKKYMKYLLTGVTVLTLSAGMSYGVTDADFKYKLQLMYGFSTTEQQNVINALNGVNKKDRETVKDYIYAILGEYNEYVQKHHKFTPAQATPHDVRESIILVGKLNDEERKAAMGAIKADIKDFTFDKLGADYYTSEDVN